MHRYLLLPCCLIAALLIASCGATGSSGATQPAAPVSTAPVSTAPVSPAAQPTSAAAPTAGSAATSVPATASISLKLISDAVEQPVYVTHAGDKSGRLFVVEKRGQIIVLRPDNPAPAV